MGSDGREAYKGIMDSVEIKKYEQDDHLNNFNQSYQAILDHHPDLVFTLDLTGNVLSFNNKVPSMFGYDCSEISGSFKKYVAPESLDHSIYYFQQACNGRPENYDIALLHKNGSAIEVNINLIPIIKHKKIVAIFGIAKDITKSKGIEKKLKENEEQFKKICNNLEVCIWSQDLKTKKILFVSEGLYNITGYSSEEMMTNSFLWKDIIYEQDHSIYFEKQNELKKGKSIHHQYRIIHRNGSIRWLQDQTIPFINEKGDITRLDGIISDITEQKSNEEQIAYFAYHDYLTDLPNRRMFDEVLQSLIEDSQAKNQSFAVIFLDMDRFKYINDSLNHDIGHELLIQIGHRLVEMIPDKELVARIGGDEFAILLRNNKYIHDLNQVGEQIIQGIKEPFTINDYELYVSASVGICQYPLDGKDAWTLLKNTDSALYRAKDLGKDNYVVYSQSIMKCPNKSTFFEKDVRRALTNNEFRVDFQPRIDVKTNKMVSAEALIRWEHPERGLVLPGEFIPFAEESGLIVDIGDWVIRYVCEQIRHWQVQSMPVVPVSINISPKSFLKRNWSIGVMQILQDTGISPDLLEFEITERIIMQNEKIVYDSIKDFKERGITFSLDDFGTGYASITYLKQFQFEYVKIDRSLIQNIHLDSQDASLTKAIIELAHGLRMKVVAEGIETVEQFKILQSFQCDEVQGYLYSKPLKTEQFESFMSKGIH